MKMFPDYTIDYDTALNLLEKAVADKGAEYRYTVPQFSEWLNEEMLKALRRSADVNIIDRICWYFDVDTGEPACMLGHAIDYIGVTLNDIEGCNESGLDILPLPLTAKASMLWRSAQQFQDGGLTWGEALEKAKKLAEKTYLDDTNAKFLALKFQAI